MTSHLALLLALTACGPRPSHAIEPLAVSGAEARALHDMAASLEEGGEPRAARLALALADGQADPAVRRAAVGLLASLERARPGEAPPECPACECPEVATEDTAVPGADADGEAAVERALVQTARDRLEAARAALRRADYAGALDQLEPLRHTPAWPSAEPFWVEAVDGYVGAERERAGVLYVEARSAPRSRRRAALLEVRGILAALLDRYPESAYVEPLERNLEKVERELELLE